MIVDGLFLARTRREDISAAYIMSSEEGTIFSLDELGRTMVVVLCIFKCFAHLRAVLASCGRWSSVASSIFLIGNENCSHELLAYADPSLN